MQPHSVPAGLLGRDLGELSGFGVHEVHAYAWTKILLMKITDSAPPHDSGYLKIMVLHTLNWAILCAPMALTALSIPKKPNLLLMQIYLSSTSNLPRMCRCMCASKVNFSVVCVLFFTPLTHLMPPSHWMYFSHHRDLLGSPALLSSLDGSMCSPPLLMGISLISLPSYPTSSCCY